METKKRLLEWMEQHRGETLSGEALAERLNVSRNAVWKAVCALKRDGYRIDAATKTGYRFAADNDILSVEGIKPYLSDPSHAEKLRVFPALASTNITAREAAERGAEHGTAILAIEQTAGNGRYGRTFCSAPGGIYMSFVLRPAHLSLKKPTVVTAFAAVAVSNAVESVTGKSPDIKWVNDLFLNGLKICGISTEASTQIESGQIDRMILGIGVNYDTHDFPEALKGVAGSIYAGENAPAGKNRLAAEIINRIIPEKMPDEKEIFAAYKRRLTMLGKTVTVYGTGTPYEATAVDIDETGRLLVRTQNGEICPLSGGEIRVRMQ